MFGVAQLVERGAWTANYRWFHSRWGPPIWKIYANMTVSHGIKASAKWHIYTVYEVSWSQCHTLSSEVVVMGGKNLYSYMSHVYIILDDNCIDTLTRKYRFMKTAILLRRVTHMKKYDSINTVVLLHLYIIVFAVVFFCCFVFVFGPLNTTVNTVLFTIVFLFYL